MQSSNVGNIIDSATSHLGNEVTVYGYIAVAMRMLVVITDSVEDCDKGRYIAISNGADNTQFSSSCSSCICEANQSFFRTNSRRFERAGSIRLHGTPQQSFGNWLVNTPDSAPPQDGFSRGRVVNKPFDWPIVNVLMLGPLESHRRWIPTNDGCVTENVEQRQRDDHRSNRHPFASPSIVVHCRPSPKPL